MAGTETGTPPSNNSTWSSNRGVKHKSFSGYQKAGRGAKVGCIHLQVLAGGTWDAPPMLLLTCERADSLGYLINCGEGAQRFCVEHKMRLAGKLQRVLFTLTLISSIFVPGTFLGAAQ